MSLQMQRSTIFDVMPHSRKVRDVKSMVESEVLCDT